MGRICSTPERLEIRTKFWSGNPKGRDSLEDKRKEWRKKGGEV